MTRSSEFGRRPPSTRSLVPNVPFTHFHARIMHLEEWALPRLSQLLSLDEESVREILTYTLTLSPSESTIHLQTLLGESSLANDFIDSFTERRATMDSHPVVKLGSDSKGIDRTTADIDSKMAPPTSSQSTKPISASTTNNHNFVPPPYDPPSKSMVAILRKPHSNVVIEAGHVSARDEVCSYVLAFYTDLFRLITHHHHLSAPR